MKKVLIYNAHLMPMTDAAIACGFLAAEDGKIASLGEMSDCPAQGGFAVPEKYWQKRRNWYSR